MIVLRTNQAKGVGEIRDAFAEGKKSPLFVAPCGFGKTVLFSYVAQNAAAKGNSVMILAHRGELLDQISRSLSQFDVHHGFIAAGYDVDGEAMTQVASVQTLVHRLDKVTPPKLIILDEAHHATLRNTIGKIFAAFPAARRLGVTATPCRLSGEGLGDVFDCMILGPSTKDLTEMGLLSPARVFAPTQPDLSEAHIRAGDFVQSEAVAAMDKPSITGDAVSHYLRLAKDMPFVTFCLSIEHATHVAKQFRDAGVNCVEIHGRMDHRTRTSIIADFRAHRITGLCSVDLISEGFDVPGIYCGISLRPTASLSLWIQQVGRCLRIAPGKKEAIILDHAGNALRHGLPTDDQEWTLEGREKGKKRGETQVAIRICPNCFSAQSARTLTCKECGQVFETKSREVEQVAGELAEITARMERRQRGFEQSGAQSREELIALGRSRGYRNPAYWADHVLRGRRART